MSRFVEWRGKFWGRGFFEPRPNLPPGTCARCGDLGLVAEEIDEERYDVAVPCYQCRVYCQHCGEWVKRAAHVCSEGQTA